MNKYLYIFVVQGKYGSKFEDLCYEDTRKEAVQMKRDYIKNESISYKASFRIISRRIPNPAFK